MLWEVSDEGRIRVVLEAKKSQLVEPPQAMIQRYLHGVTTDFQRVGIELLSDEYRIRLHRDRDLVQIFWNAQVPAQQVADAREYMMTLAQSHDGG